MRVAVDENIPRSVVDELKRRNWDVLDIRGTADEGMDDHVFWKKVQSAERLFITTDKGFAQHRDERHFGLLIVNLKHPNSTKIYSRVFHALDQFDSWQNRLVVIRVTVQTVWKQNN